MLHFVCMIISVFPLKVLLSVTLVFIFYVLRNGLSFSGLDTAAIALIAGLCFVVVVFGLVAFFFGYKRYSKVIHW